MPTAIARDPQVELKMRGALVDTVRGAHRHGKTIDTRALDELNRLVHVRVHIAAYEIRLIRTVAHMPKLGFDINTKHASHLGNGLGQRNVLLIRKR